MYLAVASVQAAVALCGSLWFSDVVGYMPIRQTAELLTAPGLTGKRGNPISPSTLQHALCNPFYAGKVRLSASIAKGTHDSLIDQRNFTKVQSMFWPNKK